MNCANCGRANRADARFCAGCGKPLAPRCPACGAESESDAQFCDACGAALVARPAEEAVARKVVTIVFADLIGSTSLHERLDAESVRRLMDRYYRALRTAVEAHGGTIVKLLGDGVMAAFGVPRVAEDDAVRAVRAAVDMQRAFRALIHEQSGVEPAQTLTPSPSPKLGEGNRGEGLGLRVAVNTGEVVVSADHADVVGDPVNVAARLQQEAHDGDVLIGESTRRLVSDRMTLAPFGALTLKGRSEKVAAYRVVSLDRPADAPTTPFVGRDDELRRLMAVYDAAVAARGARLAVILGSPGLGKSRLLAEFARRLGSGATVLSAHCDAAGGATFAPLVDALRAHLRIDDGSSGEALRAAVEAVLPGNDAERARIAAGISALLAGTPAEPEETFFVVRRFLTALAATQPLVLAIDDLQEAEPLLLDLTEHLVQWSSDVPLFVLVAARPELRDARSSLAVPGSLVSEVVTLAGLDAGAATRLAANVIGADELPAALAGRVLATSEGNPLFVSELVRMLVQDGALKREGDRWTTGVALASFEMPPTIHALLAARIERLRPDERTVLERAAIVGRQFSRAAVAHLLPREMTDLDAGIEALRRSELIEPDTGWFLGEPVLRFHHMLIRDAAYRRLLKGTRAELHARFADWVETRVGDALEHDETVGWHLEQAHHHLRDLGPIDAHGRALGERAARYLAAAGRRALARDDLPVAASLLGRALDLLDAADPARADLALDWCEALLAAGNVGPAASAIAELGRWIGEAPSAPSPTHPLSVGEGRGEGASESDVSAARSPSGTLTLPSPAPNRRAGEDRARLRAWHTCFAGQLAVLTDPQALRDTADTVAAAAAELAAAGDAAGEAKAHSVHALALARLGKIGACEAALDRALAAARSAGDRRRANAVLAGAPLAALWGPSPVTRASGRCLDVVRVLRITQGAPAVEAVALRCQAVLEALRGRTEAARRMIASSRRMVEELGITQRLLEADVFAGLIELLEGDAAAAERCLRVAYEGLRNHGLAIDAAQAAALLGRALLAQGRAEEAEALSHASEDLAGDDLKAAIAWRGVRAEALARRGEHAAAVELARAAVDIAAATDALLDHADARLALTTALCAAGRSAEAQAEERRVIELWEAKGATLLAERARRAAGPVSPYDQTPADGGAPGQPVPRRVRPNAATANAARLDAAIATRNADVFPTLLADVVEMVHHPTGVVYDRQGGLDAWYTLLGAQDLTFGHEPLATLGDSLALFRTKVSFSALPENPVAPVGAASWDEVILIEVDARGQRCRAEFFAANRLGAAVSRMYERYAELLPESPERSRAAAMARSVAAVLGPFDLERYAVGTATDVEYVDHRTVGFPSGRGVAELLRSIGTLLETADDVTTRVDDVLALRADAFLVRWTTSGTDRISRGAFEWQFLRLCTFGADGLLTRAEQFDVDRVDAALARFDELVPSRAAGPTAEPPAARFANAACRCVDTSVRCWDARDWQGVVDTYAATARLIDRRSFMALDLEASEIFATLRFAFDMAGSRSHGELLATRGDRLALFRWRMEAPVSAAAGRVELDYLTIVEVEASGRMVLNVLFNLEDLDAAYVDLDDRYAAGEGAPYAALLASWRAFRQAANARDWDAARRLLPNDFTLFSHRRLASSGLRLSRDEFISSLSWGNDRGVRSEMRRDHLPRLSARAAVEVATLHGSLDDGGFEQQIVLVVTHDGSHLRAFEAFDLDQLDAALARYEELTRRPAALLIENAATRSIHHFEAAWEGRDWDGVVASVSPSFRQVDRRAMMRIDIDRDTHLEWLRMNFEMHASHYRFEVVATRGDRLALAHMRFDADDESVGPTEVESLIVVEVTQRSERVAVVLFDADDFDAAYAELDARYTAGEAAADRRTALTRTFTQSFAARDWDALATLLAPDLVVNDHRVLGWEPLHGPAAYVQALKSLVDLAPDVRLRVDHVTMSGPRFLYVTTWVGTREGGLFESPSVILCELDAMGLIRRFDQYDLDQLDIARARFEELCPVPTPTRSDPLRIPPNAATRASDRYREALKAGDIEATERLCAPDMVFDDRRRGVRLSGDRAMFIANNRLIASSGTTRVRHTLLATWGERLALHRLHWEGGPDGGPFEMENLSLMEVDAEGCITAIVAFDPSDCRAASLEMQDRYARSDAARALPAGAFEGLRAINEHDLDQLRAALPENFVFHDHRRTGVGRLETADAFLASLAALFQLAPDFTVATLYTVAIDTHAELVMAHAFGTLAAGGDFEAVYARLTRFESGRAVAMELFEPEDLDLARARFAEWRPDLVRIPPNAASRVRDRVNDAFLTRDWATLRSLASDDFVFDDRRKWSVMRGGVEMWIKSLEVVQTASGVRFVDEPIGTVGDRIALQRRVVTGAGPEGDVFESEFILLTEIGADARLTASINFELEDRDAAFAEAQARFAAGEGAGRRSGVGRGAARVSPVNR